MQFLLKIAVLLGIFIQYQCVHSAISSAQLPMEARDDSSSQEEDVISTSYVLPNQIFNDGKPYYASKDPISGQLDFNAKKPAGIETAANEVIDPKEKIVLSNSAPNIHDFLNLPVKYSSSKFVYPLVSSSYANLKYQGSNKNYMTNKKPTSVEATAVTPTPEYNHQNKKQYTIPSTKLMAVPSTASKVTNSPTTATTIVATTTSTTTTTSKKPPMTTTAISTPVTHPTSTSIKTSVATSTSILTPSKYSTVSRKPIPISSTTPQPKPTATTTRKKFMPTKKYTPTSPTSPKPSTPLRFPDQQPLNSTVQTPTKPTTPFTTKQPTKSSSIFPTETASTNATKFKTSNTKQPITFTKQQPQPSFTQNNPSKSTTRIPNLNPADIYQTLGQKNTLKETEDEQKPTMTLADIFNSLADEESAIASNNPGHQGFDGQGNLKQPFKPSKPSPFAMQGSEPSSSSSGRPAPTTSAPPQHYQQNGQQPLQHLYNNDQHVLSGSQENFSNEYVSYQVKQPNVMQYRPAPGAINNVVISPGQNSASFVLGSQQQVGTNAFGTVEKEPLHPVQYGTVINELPPQKTSAYPHSQAQSPSLRNSDNFGNQEEPPAPPSPYQQLPLVGGPNLRPQNSKPQITHQTTPNDIPSGATNQQQQHFPQTAKQEIPSSGDQSQSAVNENHKQTNIRFPMNDEQHEEQLSVSVAAGPPAGPQVNGHAQPLSLQQIQQTNQIVFPKTKDEEQNSPQYQEAQDIQIQQHEVVTMNQHKQKLNFPQSSEHHTPSTHMEPPPPPPPASPTTSEYSELPKRPHLNRPHGPPPPFAYNEYTRKPIPGITRPNTDRHLPNILPQFRPNAKISIGHPGPNFNQEPGNIRIPPGPSIKRPGPQSGPPQFAHRRQPLMQQPRYPAHRASDYSVAPSGMGHPIEANRRIYRLPPYGGQGYQYVDRTYARHPVPYASIRPNLAERHAIGAPLGEPDIYKTLSNPNIDMPPERMAAFEEEDLVINDPPQPVTPSKDRNNIDESKLEPVVTLQMLQSQKKPLSLPNDDTGSGEIQVSSEPENSEGNLEKPSAQSGLYVVYPMAGRNTDTSDISNAKDVTPANAHVESATRSEYQNTPFTVVRDEPQEPILTVKNKKPQSLQQQAKSQHLKDKFPYPIEKPDPSYTELTAQNRIPGVLVAPRIVHGIYSTGTEAPIAIAYTPTEPNSYRKHNEQYSNVNLASSVIGEIRTDSQTEDGFSNDFDLRAQNLEKNFMAPFYPSISLDTATNAPGNGWNVLSSSTDSTNYEKNKINRADVAETNARADHADNRNNNFESDNFQPELQGGFKPIYPPGYKIDEIDDSESLQQFETNNRPFALASRMETTPQTFETRSTSMFTTSTTSKIISSTTPKPQKNTIKSNKTSEESTSPNYDLKPTESQLSGETTTKGPKTITSPTQRKKTTFETSLEALLFGDDADFDSEARKEKPKAISSPRIAPRSGPRNLKLS